MKIVVLDGYTENPGDLSWDKLAALGELTVNDRVSYAESPEIAEKLGDCDIAVTNKTPISRETIDKCPNLKFITVMATGYNIVHYNLPEAQQSAIEHFLQVQSFPTYKLIDRNGNVLDVNADPRDLEGLARLLENLK